MASRQSVLAQRRLKAIENLWLSVISQNQLKALSLTVVSLKLDVIAKEISSRNSDSAPIREFMDMYWKSFDLENYKSSDDASFERPFLSANLWALYSARHQIMITAFLQFTAARGGLDPTSIAKTDDLLKNIVVVMPEFASYVENNGISALPYLIDPIENKLLVEIQLFLQGNDVDDDHITKAAAIIEKTKIYQEPPLSMEELPSGIRRKIVKEG